MRLFLFLLLPAFVVALIVFLILGLRPPDSIRFAAGIDGGGYWQIGQFYKAELARDGINVELVQTEGSLENIQKLVSGEVDVAFVQGGIDVPKDQNLQSLGALFPEPLVVFRSKSGNVDANPGEWADVRLAAGVKDSGTRAAAISLIQAAGLQDVGIRLIDAAGSEAIEALYADEADAVLFVAPLNAPYLMEAIFDPEVIFVPMALVDALALKIPGARSVTVPAGSISLDPPRPPEDVKIITLTASLLTTGDLHPAAADRLANAAIKIHSERNALQAPGEYPNIESPPVPLEKVSRELITTGSNVLHNYLPYWIAAQFGRILLLLLPLLFLAPILRIIPSGYVWFQKRRVWRFYQRIAELEGELVQASTSEEVDKVASSIEEVDMNLATLKLPLAYRQGAYDARLHIDLIRQEIMRRRAFEA